MKRIDEQAAFSNPQKYGEILSQLCRNIVKNMEKSELVKRIDEESAFQFPSHTGFSNMKWHCIGRSDQIVS